MTTYAAPVRLDDDWDEQEVDDIAVAPHGFDASNLMATSMPGSVLVHGWTEFRDIGPDVAWMIGKTDHPILLFPSVGTSIDAGKTGHGATAEVFENNHGEAAILHSAQTVGMLRGAGLAVSLLGVAVLGLHLPLMGVALCTGGLGVLTSAIVATKGLRREMTDVSTDPRDS